MGTNTTRKVLVAAFREVTLAMSGVLTCYDADYELVAGVADAISKTFHGQLQRLEDGGQVGSPRPMDDLLDEIEAG